MKFFILALSVLSLNVEASDKRHTLPATRLESFSTASRLVAESVPHRKELRSKTGYIFTEVTEADLKADGIKDPGKFGEAWKEPLDTKFLHEKVRIDQDPDALEEIVSKRLVWGDAALTPEGKVAKMFHADAIKYCQDLGARLPTQGEYQRLGVYLGGKNLDSSYGYEPDILPHLYFVKNNDRNTESFWTSSINPYFGARLAMIYYGRSALIAYSYRHLEMHSVRCVYEPK